VSEGFEDVRSYSLDDDVLERLLQEQTELTFMWGTQNHWPVGVFMSFVWRDGSFWLTATTQRARIRAIKRDPRVSVAVSSVGTSLGRQKSATAKGHVIIHEDDETRAWYYPALAKRVMPGISAVQRAFVEQLDSEHRVVLEVVPEKWITFDVSKMKADSAAAMAKAIVPESAACAAERFGLDIGVFAQRVMELSDTASLGSLRGVRDWMSSAVRQMFR
jgi:nitroimidazol reductase NimA-like FMN-containing flavoprotein (pyridoxamine 5'-phosphate oxidase superfamily)